MAALVRDDSAGAHKMHLGAGSSAIVPGKEWTRKRTREREREKKKMRGKIVVAEAVCKFHLGEVARGGKKVCEARGVDNAAIVLAQSTQCLAKNSAAVGSIRRRKESIDDRWRRLAYLRQRSASKLW